MSVIRRHLLSPYVILYRKGKKNFWGAVTDVDPGSDSGFWILEKETR